MYSLMQIYIMGFVWCVLLHILAGWIGGARLHKGWMMLGAALWPILISLVVVSGLVQHVRASKIKAVIRGMYRAEREL